MGVDGKLSAGYTPAPRTVTITLEASSPSLPILSNIVEASQVTRKPFKCQMYITIPALGKEYTLANGVRSFQASPFFKNIKGNNKNERNQRFNNQ